MRGALIRLADFFQVHMLGARLKFVDFGAEMSQGSPNWCAQID